MFVTKVSKVLLDSVLPMILIFVNIIHKQVLKVKKDKKLLALEYFKDTLRMPLKLSKITIVASFQTIFLFTEMELEIQ
jgi:hypothetical protein